ncbi:MAG TPA: glycosyltransferase family 39 protein, partial [Thermomicrobiales bacterium]|nr:glycosyltransferase family 39 protein [Thermomicrobiales bacterium]
MEAEQTTRRQERIGWMLVTIFIATSVLLASRFSMVGHTDRRMDMGQFRTYARADAIWFGTGIFALTVLFALALLGSGNRNWLDARKAWIGAIGSALAFVPMYPVTAIDLFNYAGQSRIWTDYGLNPNVVPIAHLPHSKWTTFAGEWAVRPSPYGPLWRWLSAPTTVLSSDNLFLSVLLLKLLMGAAVLLAAWFVAEILRLRGQARTVGIVAVAWSPFVLWEGNGNAHNDIVMGLFLILALWAFQRGSLTATIPLLVAAALIKYTVVIVLPVVALAALLRTPRGRRSSLISWWAIDSLFIALFAFWPYYQIRPIIDMAQDQTRLTLTSPLWLLQQLTASQWAAGDVADVFKPLALVLLMIILAVQWLRVARDQDQLFSAVTISLSTYLLLAAWQFRGWYLLPAILAAAA